MTQNKDNMMYELKLASADLDGIDISVKTLYDIYKDYLQYKELMQEQAEYFARILNACQEVNSVKWRVKDPFHLINKIIRKKKNPTDNPKYENIDVSNYREIITDLIGLRVIFIFKAHWSLVDEYIFKMLDVCSESPITIYHANDDDLSFFPQGSLVKEYEGSTYNYALEQKDSRYRSIHYTLQDRKPANCKIELQARSILDEAWGEIDHHVRYPDNENEPELLRKMSILNGQISGCEEHASQSYNYFTKLEASRPENIAILEDESRLAELIKDSAKVEDDVQVAKEADSYQEATNDISIKSFELDQWLRLSKIVKSTQPLRGFVSATEEARKTFEQLNKKGIDSNSPLGRALGATSATEEARKTFGQLNKKGIDSNSALGRALGATSATEEARKTFEQLNKKGIDSNSPLGRALGTRKDDDND